MADERTKADLLNVMDEIWAEFETLLPQFADKLATRMPIDAPSWTGRQFLSHLLGSLQSNAYYLTQPADTAPIETVLGDPYWVPISATATLASFRAMMWVAHIGTRQLVETLSEADLRRTSPTASGRTISALELVHFNYHVHLRSHVADLRAWVGT